MISKCVVLSHDVDSESRVVVFKSGFKGLFVIFYEDPFYISEFEYIEKQDLINKFPEVTSEIEEM